MLKKIKLQGTGVYALVLEGREAILEQYALLAAHAERCGQAEILCWLSHLLDMRSSSHKYPNLFLLLYPGASPDEFRSEDIHAAVLLFEHRLFGFPTGVYVSDSELGFQTVIAPESERHTVAIKVLKLLLQRNGHIVKISGNGKPVTAESISNQLEGLDVFWTRQERELRYLLHLGTTFEETLARLGKSTRFNLRYYRRRLLRRMQCEVVADAWGQISRQELELLNANSRNPVPFPEFEKSYDDLSRLPGGYLFGVREAGGRWLGLVGGWRQGTTTVLYWQLNVRGYSRDSLINVVRSYFLEHEVEQGARNLFIYGGTSHSMQHSFEVSLCSDLMVRRRTLRASLIRFCMRMRLLLPTNPSGERFLKLGTGRNTKWSYIPSPPLQLEPQKVPRPHP